MTAFDPSALIDQYLAAYNRFDVDAMLSVLTTDVRFEHYTGETLTTATEGLDALRKLAEQSKSLFSTREQRVTALQIPDAQTAVAQIAYRGQLAVDVPEGPTAGTVIEVQGSSTFSFREGRICKIVDRC